MEGTQGDADILNFREATGVTRNDRQMDHTNMCQNLSQTWLTITSICLSDSPWIDTWWFTFTISRSLLQVYLYLEELLRY